ncbi:class I SAM-dependent methyltransferase [Pseudomonas chlororaphis]|uniref:Siderophore biosynthesis protein n=1 Tax=Pseudomonas chlororaphis TaxID=587753 RepID=A0A1Q8EP52_9PSED|nr:class I SAM-dependent methyltransferase [Pseudomonas chlororaphis]OLF53555.1 siderophore biosynthesis protein [Pseudomonas chlororaphis]
MNHELARLEHLSLGAMAQVLLTTQALPLQATRSSAQINQALGTTPRHAWIVRRWLAALSRAGLLHGDDGHLAWHGTPPEAAVDDLPRLYAALGFPASMATLHARVIAQLPALLRDQTALAPLLFEAGEPVAVLGAYQRNRYTAAINAALGERARQVEAAGESLQVLELGGGAGATTAAVLAALDGRAMDYRFSDISPLFTIAAQRQFRLEPGMSFTQLDLDRDLVAQGVDAHGLDLVIAGNVLHNARDLRRSLGHLRACLRPGGTLLFSESIADNPAMLTFMHLLLSPAEGAPPRASDEVFLSAEQWRQALLDEGFELTGLWPTDDQPLAAAGQRLFQAVERGQ